MPISQMFLSLAAVKKKENNIPIKHFKVLFFFSLSLPGNNGPMSREKEILSHMQSGF